MQIVIDIPKEIFGAELPCVLLTDECAESEE